jgi:RNA polymerase subunit RPABC4/transcription elongation factor Spt4
MPDIEKNTCGKCGGQVNLETGICPKCHIPSKNYVSTEKKTG